VRIGGAFPKAMVMAALASCGGCGLGARNFRKMQPPAPLVRAQAVGQSDPRPDSQVVPALIGRLEDSDPVVRLAAHEELRRRTRHDFGFVPWGSSDERRGAISRWRSWLLGRSPGAGSVQPASQPPPPAQIVPPLGGTSRPSNL
jgi:hypothetical protein